MRYAFLALVCLGIFLPSHVSAQMLEKTSSSEDIAIAFFKVGGVAPDFVKWAKKSSQYATVQKAREGEYLEKETRRLNALWNGYNPNQDILIIRANVQVALSTIVSETGDVSHSMAMSFEKGAADYFPYEFQDYMIAVIPQKLNTFMSQPLPPAQFDLLQSSFDGSMNGRGVLYLMLRAVKADMTRPYEMDNHEQWMFITDVAGLSLKNSRGSPLWNYSAPWYVTPTTEGVRDLFIQQEQKERADDAAEGIIP